MSEPTMTAGRPGMAASYGIQAGGAGLLPWSWVEERMAGARNYWVCTTRPDGRPHVAPIWGVWLEGALFFGSDRDSRKARNLAANPALAVHLESGDEVVIAEGLAAEVLDQALVRRVSAAYHAKYGIKLVADEHDDTGDVAPSGPLFAMRPTTALAWREADFPNTATRFVASVHP